MKQHLPQEGKELPKKKRGEERIYTEKVTMDTESFFFALINVSCNDKLAFIITKFESSTRGEISHNTLWQKVQGMKE